ncbi:DUF4886 domain-containing protein [Piscibacillus halophilus]|uniref:DUF4886 domain-containing protein n=1 Tax=Piscibacillus halophilus TaxID=571933 RepID=UPI00158DEC0C|nr:DUF4886 domain-containing protein [Piscibacillus halophilus]
MERYKEGISQMKQENLKILMIGNSYALNAVNMLTEIAKSAGVHCTVGVIYDPGQSLQGHWEKIQNNETVTYYDEWSTDSGGVREPNVTHNYCITKREWDLITYQQNSNNSTDYTTFQPYLNNLHDYVQNTVRKPNVEYGLHLTWARAEPSSYSNSQEMYRAIVNAYQIAMFEMDFDIIIPTGTAIESARTNKFLEVVNERLTTDNSHLDEGIGYYIASLTVFQSLYSKDILKDVSFAPNGQSKFLSHLSKIVAKQSSLNPYKITEI